MSTNRYPKRAIASLAVGVLGVWGTYVIVGLWSDYAAANVSILYRVPLVALLMVIGPGALAFWGYTTGAYQAARSSLTHTDLATRITTLANQLTNSLDLIASIEREVKARQELVKQLESQKEIAQAAVSLTKTQVDALAQLLNIEIQKGEKRSAARDYILFTAGIFASLAVTIILKAFGLP